MPQGVQCAKTDCSLSFFHLKGVILGCFFCFFLQKKDIRESKKSHETMNLDTEPLCFTYNRIVATHFILFLKL